MALKGENNTKKKENEWITVIEGISVIGTKKRFSISFEINEDLRVTINGCRIVEGKNGIFISYPAWKDSDGNYHDYARTSFTNDDAKEIAELLAD